MAPPLSDTHGDEKRGLRSLHDSASGDKAAPHHGSDERRAGGRRRSADVVHEALREAILSGGLPQGAVLSQVQLAQQFGVSRTPLREALRMLQVEGFVDSVPNRRVRVAEVSVGDLEQLYAQRIVLEALAVRLSVPYFSADDFAAMRRAHRQ